MSAACVYRFYDRVGRLLYVGCTTRWPDRMQEHRVRSSWFVAASDVTTEWFDVTDQALAAEARAICTEYPLHNVMHKAWPPISLSNPEELRAHKRRIRAQQRALNARQATLDSELEQVTRALDYLREVAS